MIDNLLEASRLQSGAFKLELSDAVFLDKLAEETARKFGSQSEQHTFKVEFPADFPTVRGDERRLVQVLNNLIGNAIKYAPEGGNITISGKVYGDDVMVSVRDMGIGIPVHEHHRIFQQFSRLDNALSRSTEGAGLGLFLTKAIVEAHNGRIWFSSNEAGPGTTFTFCLPRNQDESQAER